MANELRCYEKNVNGCGLDDGTTVESVNITQDDHMVFMLGRTLPGGHYNYGMAYQFPDGRHGAGCGGIGIEWKKVINFVYHLAIKHNLKGVGTEAHVSQIHVIDYEKLLELNNMVAVVSMFR